MGQVLAAEAPDPELLKICPDVCHGAKLGEGPGGAVRGIYEMV